MGELMFVIKSLGLAILVAVVMQMKMGSLTIENHAILWIQQSAVSAYLQDVAAGGALAIRNASKSVSDFISRTFGNEPIVQKAGRLHLDFKRQAAKPAPTIQETSQARDSSDQ